MHNINEGYLNKHDVEDVLKSAANLKSKNNPGFMGWGKAKFSIETLQKEWAKAGHPSESRELYKFLRDQGYARKEVNQLFRDNFETTHGKTDTENSPAVVKLANVIKQYGYTNEILHFLETQYDFNDHEDEKGKKKKFSFSRIRDMFERIINEERSDLPVLQKQFEQQHLGRSRK